MKRIRTQLFITFFALCLTQTMIAGPRHPISYNDSVLTILARVNNYWQSHHKPETPAFWNWAAYHTGNMELVKLLKEDRHAASFLSNSANKVSFLPPSKGGPGWISYSLSWAQYNSWSGATEKDPHKWLYKNYGEDQQHVLFADWQICFQTYIDLYNIKPEKKRIARAKEVMSYVADHPAHDYWWWADALYMGMPVMTKMYKLTGQEKYLDTMYECIQWSDSIMLDSATGLYFRDARYVYPQHKTNLGKKDFWARGNGWVLAGLAKVLQDLPHTYKHYQFFVDRFRRLASAVASCQQSEGYWTRSMLDPHQAPGPETSGTAFFTYGILWGINNGYLSETDYLPVASKAWTYLTHTALQQDGSIGYVQPIGDSAIPGQMINQKSQADFGVGAFLLAGCEYYRWLSSKDEVTVQTPITITNNTDNQREELVEINAKEISEALGITDNSPFLIRNAAGQELDYQITHDGKLLIDASVQPHSSLIVYAEKGQPKKPHMWVHGAQYKSRKDDIAWENDRCAYRVYGPALQATGEKSYGIDVWVKNTPDLVLDERYAKDYQSNVDAWPLEGEGRTAEAQFFHTNGSFHLDHGNGFDGYGVGPTLGCGTPAYINKGNLVLPYCYKDYKILNNGPLRFTVRLDFGANVDGVVEHRVISLDKGSHFNKITVWYDGISKPVTFCAGVVLNGNSSGSLLMDKNIMVYADPTDRPDVHGSQIYVATFFPYNDVSLGKTPDGKNAVGMIENYTGQSVTYYAGAAWSRYDVTSFNIWKEIVGEEIKGKCLKASF